MSEKFSAMKLLTFLLYFPMTPLLFMAWIDDGNLGHLLCGLSLIPALAVGLVHLKQPTWRSRLLVFLAFLVAGALGLGILVFGWLAISLLFASAQGAQAKNVNSLLVAFTALVELVVPILGALVGSRIAARRGTNV